MSNDHDEQEKRSGNAGGPRRAGARGGDASGGAPIPADFWAEMKAEGLIDPAAPTPAGD